MTATMSDWITAWSWSVGRTGLCSPLSRNEVAMETRAGRAMAYRHVRIRDVYGSVTAIEPVVSGHLPRWAANVSARRAAWDRPREDPFFLNPVPFVLPPVDEGEPFHSHNHCPAITWCPNGDLLAAWFSTEREQGTEMTILASRLRAGSDVWDPSSEFFNAPARNLTGTSLFTDGDGTLWHFNGVGPQGTEGWEKLALLVRTSGDNGATWSPPRPISKGHRYQRRHQVIAGTSITPDGTWLQPCDGTPHGEGPTAVHVSHDCGHTWRDAGGNVRGIHAGVVGLGGDRLLAFGRGQELDGRMPLSRSDDLGASWRHEPSPFPPIGSGQRLVLMRLREGPLLFASFTDPALRGEDDTRRGIALVGRDGRPLTGFGLFAALSFDEGGSWPLRRLMTPSPGRYDGGAWTGLFHASPTEAEPMGYLAATQPPDGVIHLLSSRLHYRFNLPWLAEGRNGAHTW